MDEPEFSVAYAKMCEVLKGKTVKKEEGKEQKTSDFRVRLITRCQQEFQRDYMADFDKTKYEAELAAAETEEAKKELMMAFEAKERKARKRSLGNIRFIGELYKLEMLRDAIMHDIIKKLIVQIDEESLECLCWLLRTIGSDLDKKTQIKLANNKGNNTFKSFDEYFADMEQITKSKNIPSRVRFMLQDVIDLRRNSWKPRREKAGPKTIEQIHREAEREKTQARLMEMQPLSGGQGGYRDGNRGGNRDGNRRGQQRDGNRGGGQGGPGGYGSQQPNEDGWSTVEYSRGGATKNSSFIEKSEKVDAQKLLSVALSSRKDADNMTFGPGNRGWGKGSGSAITSQSGSRFAAMQADAADMPNMGPRRQID